MDKPTNYAKCYAILGIFPDDDWATVRNAYQRQIRRWHPDRFQNRSHQTLAEEKTKELNYAYHELSTYHRRFGTLPPDGVSNLTPRPVPHDDKEHVNDEADFQPTDSWVDTPFPYSEPDAPRRLRYGGPAVAATILAIVYLVWGSQWHTAPEYEDLEYRTEVEAVKSGKDSPTELFVRQSGHDKTAIPVGNIERSSKLDKARMQAKELTSPQSLTPQPVLDSIPAGSFGYGSSETDVLAVQGPPLKQTEHVWYYGNSRVYFRNGKVTGWYESPTNPFNVVRDTSAQPVNDQSNSLSAPPETDSDSANKDISH